MKKFKIVMLILVLFFVGQQTKAQDTIKNYDFKDFDKIKIENINGELEIELGKQYAIIVSGMDNAPEQVQLSKTARQLLIELDSKYIVNWRERKPLKVKIIMPEISKLFNFMVY